MSEAPAPADPQQYPPCPTCLEKGELREDERPVPLGDNVWLCTKCGSEFTCELPPQQDAPENCKPETKLLKRLPPDAFLG